MKFRAEFELHGKHCFTLLFYFFLRRKAFLFIFEKGISTDMDNTYVSLRLRVQNAVSAQPSVGKLGISLVLLNFLHCNFRLWFKTP